MRIFYIVFNVHPPIPYSCLLYSLSRMQLHQIHLSIPFARANRMRLPNVTDSLRTISQRTSSPRRSRAPTYKRSISQNEWYTSSISATSEASFRFTLSASLIQIQNHTEPREFPWFVCRTFANVQQPQRFDFQKQFEISTRLSSIGLVADSTCNEDIPHSIGT